ncbi:MAG: SGNH/GDSL hydrolase family protein, partial [Bacteroidia bacterium]|nr:SGNH/GDSL hydrolase family protein [Bacteroidia bacterium]
MVSCKPTFQEINFNTGRADLSKVVIIGGQYLSGWQHGAVSITGQQQSISGILARQFQLAGGGTISQAWLPDGKGIGWNPNVTDAVFVSSFQLAQGYNCKGEFGYKVLRDTLRNNQINSYFLRTNQAVPQIVAVPLATTAEYFNPLLGNPYPQGNPYYHRFASNPGTSTVAGDFQSLNGSFVIAMPGMENIYGFASRGGTGNPLIAATDFRSHIQQLFAPYISRGIKGLLITIPDPSTLPFYTTVPHDGLNLDSAKAEIFNTVWNSYGDTFHVGNNAFVAERYDFDPDDPNSYLDGRVFRVTKDEFVLLSIPLDSLRCETLWGVNGIPNRFVLDRKEIQDIRDAIQSYNQIIREFAQSHQWSVFDLHSYYANLKQGKKWNGVDLSSEFVSGGFFSLDGFTPTSRGNALLANEIIRVINR